MKPIIIRYSLLLLSGFLLVWGNELFSPVRLPEKIPGTPINTSGLFLLGLNLMVLIKAEKRFLKSNKDTSIVKLTQIGTTICFLAEIAFQTIRQPFIIADTFDERLHYFLLGTIGGSILGATLSFLIAFQLIRKDTGKLLLLITVLIIIINMIKYAFPELAE